MSYNVMRRRTGVDAAVICRDFVEAIVHAWGQTSTNQTPRLDSYLYAILKLAYDRECTLSEGLAMIREPALRNALSGQVQDFVVKTLMQSTLFRINRFLATQLVAATLCQTGESLDLGQHVLEQGSILLVCLSTENTQISHEDATAVGSLMLSDLWTAVRRRGKREEGELTPCYVYVDEFQNYVTPTIAKGLTEASGYGLHLTLANQYPSQIIDHGGEVGRMVLNAVMATAKNKIVFQLEHPEDLDMLVSTVCRQAIDPGKVKHEIYSTKVVGHKVDVLNGGSEQHSRGTSHTRQWSETQGQSHVIGTNWNQSAGVNLSRSETAGTSEAETEARQNTRGMTHGKSNTDTSSESHGRSASITDGEQAGTNWASSEGTAETQTSGKARGEAQSNSYGRPTAQFQGAREELVAGQYDVDEEDEFERKYARNFTRSESSAEDESTSRGTSSSATTGGNSAHSIARTRGEQTAKGESNARSTNEARSESLAQSKATQKGHSQAVSQGAGVDFSESVGGSESYSEQTAQTYGESDTESESESQGKNWMQALIPIYAKELSSRQYTSIPEQLFVWTQFLDAQPDRYCLVRLASSRLPRPLYTHTVEPPLADKELRRAWSNQFLSALPFTLTFEEAFGRMQQRLTRLRENVLGHSTAGETTQTRRKVTAAAVRLPTRGADGPVPAPRAAAP